MDARQFVICAMTLVVAGVLAIWLPIPLALVVAFVAVTLCVTLVVGTRSSAADEEDDQKREIREYEALRGKSMEMHEQHH